MDSSVFEVIRMQFAEFEVLFFAGIVLALPLSWVLQRKWLPGFTYSIDVHVGYYLLSGLITLLVTRLTISFQSIKTAMANPARS